MLLKIGTLKKLLQINFFGELFQLRISKMSSKKNTRIHTNKKILGPIFLVLLVPLAGTTMTNASILWPVSTLLYSLGLLSLFAIIRRRVVRIVAYSIVATVLFIIEACFFFSYYLQNTGFNDAFFYHVRPDLLYAGVNEHLPIILSMITCLFCFLAMSFTILSKNKRWDLRFVPLGVALLVVGFSVSPPAKALASYAFNSPSPNNDNALFEQFPELLDANVTAEFSKLNKPNIVLIYAESLEQRYFDEAVFPGLVPNLKNLKDQSINFSNVSQGVGAEWTMGGLVASQCAYPLTVAHDIGVNNFDMFDSFLPKATCLGDLLEKDGYQLTFIGGADSRFAGKDKFLDSHGYTERIDQDILLGTLADKSYRNGWGAFDDTLFDFAIRKFVTLSNARVPFLQTLLTIDTHHPGGYLSKSCGTYGQGDNSSLNSVHCSDQLITKFVEQIRNSPYSENTIIIVLSDHLAMRNEASSLLEDSLMPKRLTFLVNMPGGKKKINTNPGLHYDIAPTILDLVGYTIHGQMGFGAPLTKGAGYLIGKFGEDAWVNQSAKLRAIGNTLWAANVTLDQGGINFTASNLSLIMGGATFDLRSYDIISTMNYSGFPVPTLFVFNNNSLELEKIKSYPLENGLTPETLTSALLENKEKLVFVVGPAKYLPGFSDPRTPPFTWCYFFGKPESGTSTYGPITEDIVIPFDLIRNLSQGKKDEKILRARENLLKTTAEKSAAKSDIDY